MSNIVKLVVKNVKRVSAVEVDANGKPMVVIAGENEQGKSSVIDSIAMALGGERLCPEEPIRIGEDEATIEVTLDDYIVKRRFTRKKSYLQVTSRDGVKATSPQKLLDGLVGRLSFDPLGYVSMDKHKRQETLRELIGIDFKQLDADRQKYYDIRTATNRDLSRVKAMIAPLDQDAPDERISIEELMTELEEIQQKNEARAGIFRKKISLESDIKTFDAQIKENIELVKALEERIANLQTQNTEMSGKVLSKRGELDGVNSVYQGTPYLAAEPISDKIKQADELNKRFEHNALVKKLAAEAKEHQRKSEGMTEKIEAVDKEKKRTLRMAKYPIAKLALGAEGVAYKGLPFEQCSSAEQLRVSVAIGFAMNPLLKVILIRDGSLLDEKNLALISEMAKANGGQVWIERVGHGKEATVIIEDGSVAKRKEALNGKRES